MIRETHVAIDAVAGIGLVVHVAGPVGIVVISGIRLVVCRAVPGRLRAIGHHIEILHLLEVELPLPPLRNGHEHVTLFIARGIASLAPLVGVGHVGKHLQLLVVAFQRAAHVELVLLQAAVGQGAFGLRVGIGDAQGLQLIGTGDRHVVGKGEPCLVEVTHVMLRGLPLGGGGIAHLATHLPFGEVVPREHLLTLETGTPALVRAIRRQLITLAVDRGRLETVGVATSAIEVLELRQLADHLQANRGVERDA